MKNKKIFLIIILCIILILIIGGYIFFRNRKETTNSEEKIEITPEEEISDEQMRETLVSLFFLEADTGNLKAEGRLIDAKALISNPYETLLSLLIDGPSNGDFTRLFPENTRLNSANVDKNCVTIDFSSEILNFSDETHKFNIINGVLNTLSTLNEVNSIKILVDGEQNEAFPDKYIYREE